MAEYIEREALAAAGWYLQRYKYGEGMACVENMNILDIPAADVAPVVRCKECLHSKENGFICTHPSGLKYAFPNAFCYCGAKMDGGEE